MPSETLSVVNRHVPRWARPGQAIRSVNFERAVIVGVVERVVCRHLDPRGEVGSTFNIPLDQINTRWQPIFTTAQVVVGARVRYLPTGTLYAVTRPRTENAAYEFIATDPDGHSAIISYEDFGTEVWLYEGPPIAPEPKTTLPAVASPVKMETRPAPKSRYDRDDII